ncbi:type II toxin-antitoxin system Phd/YefM family antitoxin [Methylocapsa sp. S129]|uniref:type II toxin-antitoxin system Phd/YefM family antitoxin n=1 Tax=Methylocapsa sp. S129 TaxID=1641869 RepID=UPI00131EBDB8|nr:type II toxin-antitoxin system prevent-host-death family antitoxin [Methylocapsa sp. S129]
MQVTIHAAKTNLSKLIEAALAGEEVIIARGSKPVVKLVAIAKPTFEIGILAGQLSGPAPDFFEPMSEEELAAWEGA